MAGLDQSHQKTVKNRSQLEPASFSRLIRVHGLQHRLLLTMGQLATIVKLRPLTTNTLQQERSPAEFTNSALTKDFVREKRNNREWSHNGVGPTSSKQALTLHQLNAAMRGIYRLSGHHKYSVIRFPSHSVHQTLGNAPLQPGTCCERLSIGCYWHPCRTRPLLRN